MTNLVRRTFCHAVRRGCARPAQMFSTFKALFAGGGGRGGKLATRDGRLVEVVNEKSQ